MEQTISDELVRLRDEHRQLGDLLKLIQELSSGAASTESEEELFARAFSLLSPRVPFDAGLAVMLEQNIHLHISTRRGAEALVSDALIARVRRALEERIPVSFESTEVIVKSEGHELPPSGNRCGLRHQVVSLIEQAGRPAGLVLLAREDPEFSAGERQVLTIAATQISMLLDALHARQQIRNLADTDDLTGVWNRRYFRRELAHETERARTFRVPLSLLLFDIDDFKPINDNFGHTLGDVVLSELCGAVRESLRPTDTLARYGGDEFAVILPHTDQRAAGSVAERLLDRVRALDIVADDETIVRCSVSIGIAELGDADGSVTDLIRRADEKLYDSKRQGKNRYTA
jgi:diguanylate cyclase (GGDEF)-like protein